MVCQFEKPSDEVTLTVTVMELFAVVSNSDSYHFPTGSMSIHSPSSI